jgi:hypothetical protein
MLIHNWQPSTIPIPIRPLSTIEVVAAVGRRFAAAITIGHLGNSAASCGKTAAQNIAEHPPSSNGRVTALKAPEQGRNAFQGKKECTCVLNSATKADSRFHISQ